MKKDHWIFDLELTKDFPKLDGFPKTYVHDLWVNTCIDILNSSDSRNSILATMENTLNGLSEETRAELEKEREEEDERNEELKQLRKRRAA
jgi:hypothetical protein